MQLFLLILGGIAFALWTFIMFRTLFAMRRRVVARTGKSMPGPVDTLREWGIWLRDPAYRQERRLPLMLTLAIFALAYLASVSPPA